MIEYGAQITCSICGTKQFKNGARTQFDFVGWENIRNIDLCPECSKSLHNAVNALIDDAVDAWMDEHGHGGSANETD